MSYKVLKEEDMITCPKCKQLGIWSARWDIDAMCTSCANEIPYRKSEVNRSRPMPWWVETVMKRLSR